MSNGMNPKERFRHGFIRYPQREKSKQETPKQNQGGKDWIEHPKLIQSESVRRKRSVSPSAQYDDPVDSKVFVHQLLSENNVYTQDINIIRKRTSLLPETPFKIGIEDLTCPSKLNGGSKTPKKTRGHRNSLDSALKQIHEKRDTMFGGKTSQSVSRIALPASQSATPCSLMLHPTFQSMQIGKNLAPSPSTCEPMTCNTQTVPSGSLLPSWSNQPSQAFNFDSNKLPLPGSCSTAKPNIFSQSVRRERKNSEAEECVATASSSSALLTGSEKSSSFGAETFSPITAFCEKPSFFGQDCSKNSHESIERTNPFSVQYGHETSQTDHMSSNNSLLQSLHNTSRSSQQEFMQFGPNNSLTPKIPTPQVNESWTQFSARYQNSRKRPRNSVYHIPKPLSYLSDDEEEKPKSLWSLIDESPKRKQPVMQRNPISTPDIELKDLYDSNSWFHASPLHTSTPVKALQQEEMDHSPVYKQPRVFDIEKPISTDSNVLDKNQQDVNDVLTESCFITPRASSIPKFRSLSNTLTPESFPRDSTTDMTNYCDETLDTSAHETILDCPKSSATPKGNASIAPAVESGETMVTETPPPKMTSKRITDFFHRVEAQAKTPTIISVSRTGKKTPSFTPYLSPIEETSTDLSHEKIGEKYESALPLVEEE